MPMSNRRKNSTLRRRNYKDRFGKRIRNIRAYKRGMSNPANRFRRRRNFRRRRRW